MFLSKFPQALDLNPCPRTILCYTCEVIHMLGGIFIAGKLFVDEDEYGFTGLFFKKGSFIIYENTKIQLITMQITPKANIDEQILNNPINENIDGKK